MIKGNEPDRLSPLVVEENARLWRHCERLLDEQERVWLSRPHEVAVPILHRYAEAGCARWSAWLVAHFGYDITQSPPAVLPGARLELTDDELLALDFGIRHYHLFYFAMSAMDAHLSGEVARDDLALAIRSYYAAMRRAPWLADKQMQLMPFDVQRLAAMQFVAGVVRTRLAMGHGQNHNQRLRRVIENEALALDMKPEEALLARLPADVLLTVPPLDRTDYDLRTRSNAVARAIEAELPIRDKRTTYVDPRPISDSDSAPTHSSLALSPEEEFLAVEAVRERQRLDADETAALHRLWHAAGLTDQEFKILEYDRCGYKTGGIAAAIGTSSNTVSVQKHNARKKIRRYERQHRRMSA